MNFPLTLDRFEGPSKDIAVLVANDGQTLNVPRAVLPEGARAGQVFRVTFVPDDEATQRISEETKALQAKLRETDPGGDVSL